MKTIPGVERALWDEARWVGCKLEDKFVQWEGEEGICQRLNNYFAKVLLKKVPGNDSPRKMSEKQGKGRKTKGSQELRRKVRARHGVE